MLDVVNQLMYRLSLNSRGAFRFADLVMNFNPVHKLNEIRIKKELLSNIKTKGDKFILRYEDMKLVIDRRYEQDLIIYDRSLRHGYEPMVAALLKENLKQGGIFVDVGANNGYFTIMASKLVGKSGSVFAFEPTLTTFQRLQFNVQLNDLENVRIYNTAISNEMKRLDFYQHRWSDQLNSLVKLPGTIKYNVEVTMLDKVLQGIKPDFIKIDVEGFEKEVLEGAPNSILSNDRVKLIVEYSPYHLSERGISASDFFTILNENGFNVTRISSGCSAITDGLVRTAADLGFKACNLYCTR